MLPIRVCGDLHSEFWNFNKFPRILEALLPPLPDDKETILVCAGDMGTYKNYSSTYKPLFAKLSKQFKQVITVPGNHSYYGTTGIWEDPQAFWSDKKLPNNVHYLDDSFFIYDNVMYIGACLWTDFNNSDPSAMGKAKASMNDYVVIRKNPVEPFGVSVRLQPEDTVEAHHKSVEFIQQALTLSPKLDVQVVVITHHAPCELSVSEKYKGELLNAAFYTDLSKLMYEYAPAYWIHGHMHDSCQYKVGKTEVICNPYGYKDVDKNLNYDPCKTVRITIDK